MAGTVQMVRRRWTCRMPLLQRGGPSGDEADKVRAYWRAQEESRLPEPPPLEGAVLSSLCTGLGDTMMLTDMVRASEGTTPVFSTSQHFRALMRRNPWWTEPDPTQQVLLANAPTLVRYYATGNGHYLQRLRRAFGHAVDPVPRGSIQWKGKRANNRVLMHFEPGRHVLWQRANVHPQARTVGRTTRAALEEFVARRRDLEFWCVGRAPEGGPIKGTHWVRTPTTDDLVDKVGQCGWFVGIMSGVMHVATAMRLKCVVLVNFPVAERVMVPTLRHTDQIESEWMYPQNVHLHMDGEGALCPKASADNLERAFDGGVYPYWRTDWCGLIEDPL